MRKILFRGKRVDNGEWVEGDYFNGGYDYKATIRRKAFDGGVNYAETIRVIPETIGQYTDLTDKNGKKIFEGDIVKHLNNSDKGYDIGVIYFDTEFMGWRRTTQGRFHKTKIDTYKLNPTCIYEVIGNIHDNPELLKVGADNG